MADTQSWDTTVKDAWSMAAGGEPAQAVHSLLEAAGTTPPEDNKLAPLLHIAAIYGQQGLVVDIAESYLTRSAPAQTNTFANVWALEILRRAGRFDLFVTKCLAFDGAQIGVPVFYSNLAMVLHDEDFLVTFDGDPRIGQLFAMATEQANVTLPGARHEFIFKNAFVFTSAPQSYFSLRPVHQTLLEGLLDQLEPSANLVLMRLQLGLLDGIDSADLMQALSTATPQELFAIWTIGKDRMTELMQLFYADKSFSEAVRSLDPKVVLTFEKINPGQPDTALRLIVDGWVDNIPTRYGDTPPAELPTKVLDQLALIHRRRRPDIYDWYIARRPDAQALTSLAVLKSTRRFPAPHLKLGRKPRVAVCISGQLRGYTQAYALVKQHLLSDVEPVIFVDTWAKIGRKSPTPAQAWRMFSGEFLKVYQALGQSIGFQAMQARYSALTSLDDASNIDVQTLASFYGCPHEHVRIEDDADSAFAHYSNPRKMYHKIRGAQDMLETSGIEVDAVLRIRPDKSLDGVTAAFNWRNLITTSHNDRVFFADFPGRTHPTSGFVIGDQAGIATMDMMHVYARAEETTVEAGVLGWMDWPAAPRAHANLSHALWINNIRIDTMPVRWGKMFDPEPLSAQAVLTLVEADLDGRTRDTQDEQLLAAARAGVAD